MAKSRLFLATLCALFLTSACATPPKQIEVLPQPTEILIPAQARSCPPIPTPPDPDVSTQRDVAAWLTDVYAAHEECMIDMRTILRIIDAYNAEAKLIAAQNAEKQAGN